jgi:hypothetical protein
MRKWRQEEEAERNTIISHDRKECGNHLRRIHHKEGAFREEIG